MTDFQARKRNRRDHWAMLIIAMASGSIIAIVLYFAGAFMRSTG